MKRRIVGGCDEGFFEGISASERIDLDLTDDIRAIVILKRSKFTQSECLKDQFFASASSGLVGVIRSL